MAPGGSGGTEAERLPFLPHEAIFEAAPDGLLVVDESGVIRECNQQAVRLLGYPRDELCGLPVEEVVPQSARHRHVAQRAEYMEHPRARPMGIGMELRALRKDGREVPVEIGLSPVESSEGRFVIAAVRDVTERRRLQNLGSRTLRATEEERRRIARELHDDTAQCLAALLVRLRVLRRTAEPEARERLLDEMSDELGSAVESVRRISRGLRPPALEDVGVEAAIRSHIRSASEHTGLDVELEMDELAGALDPEGQLVLYRIVQEALTNVVRHSGARRATVEIRRSGHEVMARVRDDGRGFDPEAVFLEGTGLGLLGMDERARIAGGELRVDSAPGEGSEVEVRLPVVEASAEGRRHG